MTKDAILEKILSSRRANPYSEKKSILELRDEHHATSQSIPLPNGTIYKKIIVDKVPAEWILSNNITSDSVFLFMHGGGYYRGSVETTRATAARISSVSNTRCLSIDYRLAPEHVFPAAIDDTYTVYKWLIKKGFLPKNIVVGGISAGGGLALALLLKLKEKNEPFPSGVVAISPWTDMTQSGETMRTNAETDPIISKPYLDRMSKMYLAGVSSKTQLASPLFGNLEGLPQILIQVGSSETMLDDSRRFAEKAKISNVDVNYEVWEDMFHGWHGSAHILEEAERAIENIGVFCKKVLDIY